jgi:hypothetical protein
MTLVLGLSLGVAMIGISAIGRAQSGTVALTDVTPADRFGQLNLIRTSIDTINGAPQAVAKDDVARANAELAHRWLAQLGPTPVSGLQLDDAGELQLMAGADTAARRAFHRRLATPVLSHADSLYTLSTAVRVFAAGAVPDSTRARMQDALAFLARLDTMAIKTPQSASARRARYVAHLRIAQAYADAGSTERAVAQLMQTLSLNAGLSFEDVNALRLLGPQGGYIMLVQLIGADLSKRRLIDSIGTAILSLMHAPADNLTLDQSAGAEYAYSAASMTAFMKQNIATFAYVGRRAAPVIGTHWYNAPAPARAYPAVANARQLPIGNGKIFVLEFGNMGCPGCLDKLPMMQRLKSRFNDVEFWYVADAPQRWGATDLTPDQSGDLLRKYYVVHHKVSLPMAVWAGPVTDSVSAPGQVFALLSPTVTAYNPTGNPFFVVVDGTGIVRWVTYPTSQLEAQLTSLVTHLVAETERARPSPNPSSSPSAH